MSPDDFLASISQICVAHDAGSDAECKRLIGNLAAECGIGDIPEAEWSEWFRFDDGSIDEEE